MWKCKKCGGEIVANVLIEEEFEFALNKNGELTKLSSLSEDTIDDVVKKCPGYYIESFVCKECSNEGDTQEEIGKWID